MRTIRISYEVVGCEDEAVNGRYTYERQEESLDWGKAWRLVEVGGWAFKGDITYSPADLLWELDSQVRS